MKATNTYLMRRSNWFSGGFFGGVLWCIFLFATVTTFSQEATDTLFSPSNLKSMSLDELMNIEVTSVTNRPEKITETPSAIQLITSNDIKRSGAVRLPEAIRLASNIQSARVNAKDWSITARGYAGLPGAGGILANKLLVMTDGRSIYTPILGGVYWDVQNMILEDVDRIEVVSGPGATLWGANAVNGIINVVSKSADKTQGVYLSHSIGDFLTQQTEGRYGFKLADNTYMRVYAQYFKHGNTFTLGDSLVNYADTSSNDQWNAFQQGFRMDYMPSENNHLTIQGDVYTHRAHVGVQRELTEGQNILSRYTHKFSENSDVRIQFYIDRNSRKTPNNSTSITDYTLHTYEWDVKHRFTIGEKHHVMWGGMYQIRADRTVITANTVYVPQERYMPLFSGFFQDEYSVLPNKLRVTFGTKISHNVYTGVEFQPSARLGFTPNQNHTLWAAVSRAIRVPSRLDADITVTENKFDSEKVIAYELGYRVRPLKKFSLSLAMFFNHYDDLRSLDFNPDTSSRFPTLVANSQRSESWGAEFSGNYQVTDKWRIRFGYTYFDNSIWSTSPFVLLPISKDFESVDVNHVVRFQSIANLPKDYELDVLYRFNSGLKELASKLEVDAFHSLDVRVGKRYKNYELSIVGQNILRENTIEVGSSKIPRSFYARVVCFL